MELGDRVNRLINGDALKIVGQMPSQSIDCVITSPPYWHQRDYGWAGQWGLEPVLEDYLEKLWGLMDELKRVLKPMGTLWINMADTYGTQLYKKNEIIKTTRHGRTPHKSLLLIPHRFAIGCMERGWIVRNDIVWSKSNASPEKVCDRFINRHEYLFFMAKSPSYYFDMDSIRDPYSESSLTRGQYEVPVYGTTSESRKIALGKGKRNGGILKKMILNVLGKIPGSVSDLWSVANRHGKEKHYATYTDEIIRKPILAGCPEGGIILDPFAGIGTTGAEAKRLGRKYILIEGSKEYCRIAESRL